MLERLKTIMIGLWYPAVLGALIILFIERWSQGISAMSRPSTWFGLFLILYYTILFEESFHTLNYTLYSWIIDLFDLGVMYGAYVCLGYGFGGQPENIKFFFGIMIFGFLEPIIWRSMENRRELILDLLCAVGIVVMLLGLALPDWYLWYAVVVIWLLLIIYVAYASLRVAIPPPGRETLSAGGAARSSRTKRAL
ncbi:MAG TPA: hypothetical protein VKU02_22135 [Gemmataceae bacterium]|nr:hypothetical protein [Gemmataceae bacterium]